MLIIKALQPMWSFISLAAIETCENDQSTDQRWPLRREIMRMLKSLVLRKFLLKNQAVAVPGLRLIEGFFEIYRSVYMRIVLQKQMLLKTLIFSTLLGCSTLSYAVDLTNWNCSGACDSLGPDGVVTSPPTGGSYGWVASTNSSPTGLAPTSITTLTGVGSDTGSRIRSPLFSATSGEQLSFYYNYVTSDGADFADYAWARLVNENGNEVILFTARTTQSGNTVPGIDMPVPAATLNPSTAPIIPGAPTWSPLGSDSGACFDTGCGYTGWVHATYSIPSTGNYFLEVGVVNWSDEQFQSGLAFDSIIVGGNPIEGASAVPTVSEWALLLMGLLLGGLVWRQSQRKGRMSA